MAGIKGKSGPPKNTNASRYGWRVLLRRALIRETDTWVRRPMESYASSLLSDKPEATAGEQHVIEVATVAKACTLLILHELKQSGFTCKIGGVLELTPAARELSRFLTVELSALKLLELERRTRAPITLNEYLNGSKTSPAHAGPTTITTVTSAGATPDPQDTQGEIHSPPQQEV